MNRWDFLSERQKEIVRLYIVEDKKLFCVSSELGISRSAIAKAMPAIYQILDVPDRTHLALWVGRNWELVSKARPKLIAVGE